MSARDPTPGTPTPPRWLTPRRVLDTAFVVLAASLLLLTLAWRVPMMLWDHLDLVPLLDAWQRGTLLESGFLHIHGGHLHSAAYAVLLATTVLSGGQTWLDCLTSWLLLLGFALVVRGFIRDSGLDASNRGPGIALLATLLCLYPGHLANLQWGWQVAVFLCLGGGALTIQQLTRTELGWRNNALALLAAGVAFFSFATAIALLPTALALLLLRHDIPPRKRLWLALPWLLASGLVAADYAGLANAHAAHAPLRITHYALNWLGAGISRFATDLALWLATAGLLLAVWLALRHWRERSNLPWLGLMLFATLSGLLTALGRVGAYGTGQAFVTRYVSFSSLFWLAGR